MAAKDLLSFECPVETGFPVLGQEIIMNGKVRLAGGGFGKLSPWHVARGEALKKKA